MYFVSMRSTFRSIHPGTRDREGVMEAMTGHVLAYGEIVGLSGG